MVSNAVDDDGLLSLVLDNSRNIFEHIIPPFLLKQVLSPLYGENNLNINLGICAWHVTSITPQGCNDYRISMTIYFNPERGVMGLSIMSSLRDLFWHRFIPFLLLCFFDVDLRILFERAVQIQIIGIHFQMGEEASDLFFGVV